jgi:hypothetical protein
MRTRLAALGLTLAAIASVGCSDPSKKKDATSSSYVGAAACQSCHAEVYSTFSRTGMGRSFYPLGADRVIEDWSKNNTFTNEATGLHYRMESRGGKFFMRQFLTDGGGRESAVDERELLYVVGSAHHSRTYLVSWGGKLFQAPVCWYTRDAVWDLCPGYEMDNDYFSREIDRIAIEHVIGRDPLTSGPKVFEGRIECRRSGMVRSSHHRRRGGCNSGRAPQSHFLGILGTN